MRNVDIAVVGATTLVGEAILDLLATRRFSVGKVYALEAATDGEQVVSFGNRSLDITPLADFDFSAVQLAFFATDDASTARYVPQAVAAGCIVIDDSSLFRMEADVPLVVAEVNPQDLASFPRRRIIANPSSNVTALATVLQPLHQAATLTRIDIATYQAVSGVGRAGVEELARQTAQLLNARAVACDVFPRQIAFNLLPRIGEMLDNGYTGEEMKLVQETRKVLALPELAINATAVRVPVFFGHAAAVHVELAKPLPVAAAVDLLRQAQGVVLVDGRGSEDFPTPVTDAMQEEKVYVGRLRQGLSQVNVLNLWLVADNVRKSAALNAVQIAETLTNVHL